MKRWTIKELYEMDEFTFAMSNGLISAQEAIYRKAQRDHTIADIVACVCLDNIDLHGFVPEDVVSDKAIVDRIIACFDKSGCGNDYWDRLEEAIKQGISDTPETMGRDNDKG